MPWTIIHLATQYLYTYYEIFHYRHQETPATTLSSILQSRDWVFLRLHQLNALCYICSQDLAGERSKGHMYFPIHDCKKQGTQCVFLVRMAAALLIIPCAVQCSQWQQKILQQIAPGCANGVFSVITHPTPLGFAAL